MHDVAAGTLGRLLYLHLEPEEDVYDAIAAAVSGQGWQTGLILTITGALSRTRLSLPLKDEGVEAPPGYLALDGLAEVSGSGYFGITQESWSSPTSHIEYEAGQPFLHIHLTAAHAGQTYMGHLLAGSTVRSVTPISHFVVVIAEAIGIRLSYHCAAETPAGYPNGVPYYRLAEA